MGSMKDEEIVLIGGAALIIMVASNKVQQVEQGISNVLNLPASTFNSIQTGVNTPGGLLGQGSATDIGAQISNFFNSVVNGINTPGGVLGANSLTSIDNLALLYTNSQANTQTPEAVETPAVVAPPTPPVQNFTWYALTNLPSGWYFGSPSPGTYYGSGGEPSMYSIHTDFTDHGFARVENLTRPGDYSSSATFSR